MMPGREDPLIVFYTEHMVADAQSFSPSALKPRKVVESWRSRFDVSVVAPVPATIEQLSLAHDAQYVRDVLASRRANGFGNRLPEVAATLPYTSGAMIGAARSAIVGGKVAVAPVSGFHHACHSEAGGFCTFNGLVVAAQVVRQEGLANRVGILDCDQHYGNGTDEIIGRLELDWIHHLSIGEHWCRSGQASRFLSDLEGMVTAFGGCELLLYQAGADPHVDDPLGGWLTTAQLRRRDRIVFETCRGMGLPIAWNLAGGYQEPFERVLEIHDNTFAECAAVYACPPLADGKSGNVRRESWRVD